MDGVLLLIPGAVLSVVYLLQPLVASTENLDAPWAQFEFLNRDDETDDNTVDSTVTATPQPQMAGPNGKRAMTDGGRVCHSCGAHVEGDYLYCAECLTPRV
jgi:hypothetical protein